MVSIHLYYYMIFLLVCLMFQKTQELVAIKQHNKCLESQEAAFFIFLPVTWFAIMYSGSSNVWWSSELYRAQCVMSPFLSRLQSAHNGWHNYYFGITQDKIDIPPNTSLTIALNNKLMNLYPRTECSKTPSVSLDETSTCISLALLHPHKNLRLLLWNVMLKCSLRYCI